MTDEARPAAPCCVCSTAEGAVDPSTHAPARFDVARYGVPGLACYACCLAIVRRLGAGLDPITNRRPTTGGVMGPPMDHDDEPLATTFDELKAKLARHWAEAAARARNAHPHKPGSWPAVEAGPAVTGPSQRPKWTYSVPELPREDVAAAAVRAAQLAALAGRLPKAGGRSEVAEDVVEIQGSEQSSNRGTII